MCISVYSQHSVADMIRYGNQAFEKKNYASSIHFYKMVIDEDLKIDRISSHPYAYSTFTGKSIKRKVNKTTTEVSDTLLEVNDTLSDISDTISNVSDTLSEIDNIDTIENESDIDHNEIYATHKIAECSRLLNHYQEAEQWYVKSLQLNWGNSKNEYPLDTYWYAQILMNNNKHTQAVIEFKNFILENENAPKELEYYVNRSSVLIANCKFALSPESKNKGINVKHGDSLLNNGTSSYGATFFNHSKILISSARNTSVEDKEKKISSNLLSDIFTMGKSGDQHEGALNLSEIINTKDHEGAPSVGDDKKTIYYTKWYTDNKSNAELHVSKYFVDRWMTPRKLNSKINVKGYTSKHPYISKNNKILFFASDMPGGFGGMDIWYCKIDYKGFEGPPINLGSTINSEEDEITPFYHETTGVLYFSSKGHKNIGGFDVFKSNYNLSNNTSTEPQNLGYPINSSRNDLYYCLSDFQTEGYLTSNREQCQSCDDVYCNQIYTLKKAENEFLLTGYVFDTETNETIPNTTITVKDVKGEFENFKFQTDSTGFYSLPLEPEMHIFIKAQKIEYFADANVQSTIGLSKSEEFVIDFYLELIPWEEIELKGILYDYDKASIRPESKIILDSLVTFLTINDNFIIEISSHTDINGSNTYNVKLSQKRAESVVNYLIESGIPPERLLAKGYGETKPVVKNAETDEDHQKNRRTSFRILSEDFKEINKIRPKQF